MIIAAAVFTAGFFAWFGFLAETAPVLDYMTDENDTLQRERGKQEYDLAA